MVTKSLIELGQALVRRLGITLEEHLGTGGFGAVYRGVNKNGQSVAVKFCEKTQYVKYLEREVKIQLSLCHENLVRLYQFVVCCLFLFFLSLAHTHFLHSRIPLDEDPPRMIRN